MRFLHTADWQLGMTRHFLSGDAQARYTEARLAAVRELGKVAREHDCAFMVVAGDVFESNQVGAALVARACDAMASVDIPVLLLPGNHDPLDAASVYTSAAFAAHRPGNVTVLSGEPLRMPAGDGVVEVRSAPWRTKRPLVDLTAEACAGLEHEPGTRRVLVAHGAVDALSPNTTDPALVNLAGLERKLADGCLDAVCLGDRHSRTCVGSTGAVWYAGTPEVTDFDEVDPGAALVFDLAGPESRVDTVRVGTWTFTRERFHVDSESDLDSLDAWFAALPDKPRTVAKLSFVGTLSLAGKARLDATLERFAAVLGGLDTWQRHTDLVVLPDDADLSRLGLSGFAADAATRLSELAATDGSEALAARDALSLLHRLAGRP